MIMVIKNRITNFTIKLFVSTSLALHAVHTTKPSTVFCVYLFPRPKTDNYHPQILTEVNFVKLKIL